MKKIEAIINCSGYPGGCPDILDRLRGPSRRLFCGYPDCWNSAGLEIYSNTFLYKMILKF
jgi:hypothetical protein